MSKPKTKLTAKPKLKKGDTVMVIAGRERGKTGKILRVDAKESRIFVERTNLVKRHQKPTGPQAQGGIIEKEASMHVSNLMLVCDQTSKPTRVGRKRLEDGRIVRFSKRSGEMIER